jgi:REP-associated tyrosine transposase
MALRVERATEMQLRHVVARTRGRRALFTDAAARNLATRRLGESCTRHRLRCVVWSLTDRCLHFVVRGTTAAITLASEEILGARLRHGHWLSTTVQADVYLLELARHALEAPVRAGLARRAIDWPHSSARESLGFAAAPAWLDPSPLYALLGPPDGQGPGRLRRYLDSR